MGLLFLATFILSGLPGCALVDPAQLTESVIVPTPDPVAARDAYVAAIYQMAKAGQEAALVSRLDQDRTAYLASPSPDATKSAYPELPTAPPTPTPTPVPTSSAGAAVAGASGSPGSPGAAVGSPTAAPIASGAPTAAASATPLPTATPTPRIPVDPALALALYKVDAGTYRTTFVDNYPIDSTGTDHDYGDRLARAHLTKDGTRYPIVEIAKIAAGGDATAMKRMLAAMAASSGGIAGQYADAVAYVAAKNPDGFLSGLAALPMGIRLSVARTSHWCVIRPNAVLAKPTAEPEVVAVQGVIRDAASGCGRLRSASRRGHVRGRKGTPSKHRSAGSKRHA